MIKNNLRRIYWRIKRITNKNKTKIAMIKNGYAKGIKLIIPCNIPNSYKEMIEGNYEEYIIKNVLNKTNLEGKTVWDIGAHFGYQSFVFSKLIGKKGRVISFEPNPNNIKTFQKNLKNNPELRNILLEQRGLSDKKEVLSFNISIEKNSPETTGSYLSKVTPPLSKSSYKNFTEIKINTETIDNLVNKENFPSPDIIKMDIEGGELNALKGGLGTLKTTKPILIIEVHSKLLLNQITNILSENDYKIEKIDEAQNTTTIIAS